MTYALAAGFTALAATALLHLLALTTPRPARFFTWIMGLLTTIAAVLPLTLEATTPSRVATATINLILGLAITSILNGVARTAFREMPNR
jgi:hypothetical protein